MTLLIASLVGLSSACFTWLLVLKQQNRRLMESRLSEMPGALQFPYAIHGAFSPRSKKDSDVRFDQADRSKLVRDLFIAGIRSQKGIRFFSLMLKLSFILPVALIIAYALMGSFEFKKLVVSVMVGAMLFIYVHLWVRLLKLKRQNRILKALPQFLDLIVVCVEAGLSFMSALERILKEEDSQEPLVQEFKLMYHEFLGGLSLSRACERLDKRCGLSDLSVILAAAVQSDEMGASLGNSLRTQAADLRDKLRQRVRAKAFQTPVKILFPTVLIFFAFILMNLGYIGYQMRTVISNNVPAKASSGTNAEFSK